MCFLPVVLELFKKKNRLHFRFIALTFTHTEKILSKLLSSVSPFAREEGEPGARALLRGSELRDGGEN